MKIKYNSRLKFFDLIIMIFFFLVNVYEKVISLD